MPEPVPTGCATSRLTLRSQSGSATARTPQARVVDPDTDEDEHARTLVYDKFSPRGHGDLVEWRARALPVALDANVLA